MTNSMVFFKKLAEKSYIYARYIMPELFSYVNYLNAFIVGTIINLLTGYGFPGKLAPYIVPVIVQTFSKSWVKFKGRHMGMLSQLPSEREDPVFIMNSEGDIILSSGVTFEILKKYNVNNIIQIIGERGFAHLQKDTIDGIYSIDDIELFSELFSRWYSIKIKSIYTKVSKGEKVFLVWFTDITEQKNHETRLSNMLQFSNSILSSLPRIVEKEGIRFIYRMLAEFVLNNEYGGVFITRMDNEGSLQGYVFKYEDNGINQSELITIPRDSSAPIRRSRERSTIVVGDISDFKSRIEFEQEFPFDERVKAFLCFPIDNFINYHEVNVSVIVFNKKGIISKSDKMLIEIIVNNIKTVLGLVEYISRYRKTS